MCSLMMRWAIRSGMAPSRALATSMRTRRSWVATTINRPSPTWRRPTFQLSPTRWAKAAMSSGWVVGTSNTTTWLPRVCSMVASFWLSAACCAASSVPVWSMTRPASGGTGSTPWANAAALATSRHSAASASRHPATETVATAAARRHAHRVCIKRSIKVWRLACQSSRPVELKSAPRFAP